MTSFHDVTQVTISDDSTLVTWKDAVMTQFESSQWMTREPSQNCFYQTSKRFIDRHRYRGGSRGSDCTHPKTYESNFIHHDLVQIGKQHDSKPNPNKPFVTFELSHSLRYKSFCGPLFCHNNVMKFTSTLLQ